MRETPSSERLPAGPLRVLVVTESFLPQTNGVTNSVCRVLEHLERGGHHAAVIAPTGPERYAGAEVHRVGGVDLPGYEGFTLGWATHRRLQGIMEEFEPDVVHIASPFVLGYAAVRVANLLRIPVVSIYQTDMVGFASTYRMRGARMLIEHRIRRIHLRSDLTLVPSTASFEQLERLGIPRLRFWPRGVDTVRFSPEHRDDALLARLGTAGASPHSVRIGYVGRLAKEKNLHHLQSLQGIPGAQLVIVGDGPERQALRRDLPRAHFLGVRDGAELAAIMASFDVFVHPGTEETFCQAVQEALASGVPAVGPAAGGLKDRIVHGTTGLLYAPGDLQQMHTAVSRLVHHEELRRTMGTAARRSVESRSWAVMNDLLIDHYLEAMTGVDALRRPSDRTAQQHHWRLHGLAV